MQSRRAETISYFLDGVGNRTRVEARASGPGGAAPIDGGGFVHSNAESAELFAIIGEPVVGSLSDAATTASIQSGFTGENRAGGVVVNPVGTFTGNYTMDDDDPPQDFQMNQYTTTPLDSRTYDLNGSLASVAGSSGAATYQYDYRNRLVEFERGSVTVSFAYDVFGRKIKRTFDDGVNETARHYIYNGWRVIEEQDASGAAQVQYVHGNYIDELIQMRRYEGGVKDFYYYCDDMYSPLFMMDETPVVGEYESVKYHGDYGKASVMAGSAGTSGNRYFFTGREWDEEVGLYEYRTRWMEPETGKYIQLDQIGADGDFRLSYIGSINVEDSSSAVMPTFSAGTSVSMSHRSEARSALFGSQVAGLDIGDGPSLNNYVQSSPVSRLDAFGKMSSSEWKKCCGDSGIAAVQRYRMETAAEMIDGFDYGSLFRGEHGCGWCAMNIMVLLSNLAVMLPNCWDFDHFYGEKYLIGTGYGQLPDVTLRHHFVALRKNIDGLAYNDAENLDSPVFDGWGGLWGNLTRRCSFYQGTVKEYWDEWGFPRPLGKTWWDVIEGTRPREQ